MKGRYYGFNDLSLKFYIEEVFLKLNAENHICKITLKENLFDLFLKNECWLKEEWNYHLSLHEAKQFIKDYLILIDQNKIDKTKDELFIKVDHKIEMLKKNDYFNETQNKYFSQLASSFLKNFTYITAISVFDDAFNIEFLDFIEGGLLTSKNKNIFDKFLNQISDFIKYWFFYREIPSLISTKINCFSKNLQDCIVQQLILLLDKKITDGIIIDLSVQETFILLKLIYDKSSDEDTDFVKNKISDFLKANEQYDGSLYWFYLDKIWDLFKTTSLKKELDLEQQYHYLKNKYYEKVNWQKLPNYSIDTKIFDLQLENSILEKINYATKYAKGLVFLLSEWDKNKGKVFNILTSTFKRKKLDNILQLFDKKIFYNSSLTIAESAIEMLFKKIII